MNDIFVSIVIPTRNRKELLAKCLESLFNQNYPSGLFEVIAISDGSAEGITEYPGQLKPKNLKIIYSFPKSGPAAARNIGIKSAKGEIIGFTDDDCILDKDWIKNAAERFKDKLVSGVEGRIFAYTKDFRIGHDFVNNVRGGEFKTCNIFYRKADIDEAGGFDEEFKYFREDSALAFKVLRAGKKIIFASDCLAKHISSSKNPVALAKRYYYDAFLKGKFPEYYNKYIEIAPFKWFEIKRPKQKLYLAYTAAIFLSAASFFLSKILFYPFLTAAIFLYSAIWIFQSKIWLVKKFNLKDLLLYSTRLLAAPFVYVFFRIRGIADFNSPSRNSPPVRVGMDSDRNSASTKFSL